ncbi:MAG: glycosyltransferase family 4 protein [Bacillota bacterium]
MKIVFPVISLEIGGGARYIYQVANGLTDRGHEVIIVMPEQGVLAWPVRAKVVRVKTLTPSSIPEADFILPNFWPTVKPAVESQKGQVVRLSLGYEPLWVLQTEQAKKTYLIGAPVISISSWHRQVLWDNTGLDSEIIHGGVDTRIFCPAPKLSKDTGRKRVFYILRSSAGYFWKGSGEFLAACRSIMRKIPQLDIQVVTPDGFADSNSGIFTVNGIPGDQKMAQLYAIADLYVFNSRFEAFGLPPLEAMACGTAVVTTDCGGPRDYAFHRKNCLMVQRGDEKKLAEAMFELLQNDDLRMRLAQAGHEFAQSWTWERTTGKIEQFLRKLK